MEQCLQKHLSLPAPAPLFHARKTDPLFQELKVLNLDTVASTPTDKKKIFWQIFQRLQGDRMVVMQFE